MLASLAKSFGYETDGGDQHVVLPFQVSPPRGNATHPTALGGKLTVSSTGYVADIAL